MQLAAITRDTTTKYNYMHCLHDTCDVFVLRRVVTHLPVSWCGHCNK